MYYKLIKKSDFKSLLQDLQQFILENADLRNQLTEMKNQNLALARQLQKHTRQRNERGQFVKNK